MNLYVVHHTIGGYAKEDPNVSNVCAVLTDFEAAKKLKTVIGYGATITEIELDRISQGYIETLKELLGYEYNNLPRS